MTDYDKTKELIGWISRVPPRKKRPVFDSLEEALTWMSEQADRGVMTVEELMIQLRRRKAA